MKLIYICLFSFCLVAWQAKAQSKSVADKAILSGYITEGASGETLIGATIYVVDLGIGGISNEYGFYSISVPKGTYSVRYSYLGFETKNETVELNQDRTLSIELSEENAVLEEVVVVSEAEDKNVKDVEMSVNKLNIKTINKIPALMGEVDVIRGIQLLPGVSTVGEGAMGFNVRGGGVDQNLVLLDEAPVYNSSHLFGFFSVFNPDAVKDVKLYKGGIPARYGGRLSSILDVRMKEGNNKRFSLNGGIGAIFSRLAIEAPIIKDKASFILAARRSYIDILAKPFLKNQDLGDTKLNFYDLTLKTNYELNKNNRIFLSGYLGRDNFGFGDQAGFNWGNATTTLRWNHLFNDRLFSNFTAYYSDYDYEIHFGDEAENSFDWDAGVNNYSLKADFTYFLNPKNKLTFGGQAIYYVFIPGNAIGVSEGESSNFSLDKKYALESGLFLENEQTFGDKLSLQYGLRFSHFNYIGKGTSYELGDTIAGVRKPLLSSTEFKQGESIQTYTNFEPRVSLKYQLSDVSSLKASYNRMTQYLHLLSNTTAATPVDVWTPSTNNIKPQIADQVALGYFRNFKNNTWRSSTEIYYKKFTNLLDYIDGANLFINELLEAELLNAQGRSYGLELQLEKKKGNFTGWLSYTLARSEQKVASINNDEWFPTRFDQTHNFNITAFYDISERVSLSATWVYKTGTPATFPSERIEQQGYILPHNSYASRHNVRIPAYHRLDASLTLKSRKKAGKRWESSWVLAVYNAYNRRNPFTIYFRQNETRTDLGAPVETEAVRFSVVGNFIPSITYNFKF